MTGGAPARLVLGAAELIKRTCALCMAGKGTECLWRILGLIIAAGTLWRASVAEPMVTVAAGIAFFVGSCLCAPPADDKPDADEELGEQIAPEELLALLHTLTADRAGVHLSTVAEHLYDNSTATRNVRALCDRDDIPVRRAVRIPGQGVTVGVHRDDLPPNPSPTSERGTGNGVAAGESSNSNINGIEQYRTREGFLITQDPSRGPTAWRVEQPTT